MDTQKTCYLFFDFDGTVTVDQSVALPDGSVKKVRVLPIEHVRAIRIAHEMGHQIFLCTGRSRGSLLAMRGEYPEAFSLPWDGMICGASDMWYGDQRLTASYISREECMAWLDFCKRTGRIFCYNGTEDGKRYPFHHPLTEDQIQDIYREVEMMLESNPLTNLSTIPAANVEDIPKSALNVIHLPTYSDLFAPGCDKGTAILQYCKLINAPVEQTICFGDSANDIEMFRVCNTRVAMKKAPEPLKAIADYVAKGEYGIF